MAERVAIATKRKRVKRLRFPKKFSWLYKHETPRRTPIHNCISRMETCTPCMVKFTQTSIDKTFSGNYGSVNQAAQDIMKGKSVDFPPLRVVIGPKGDYYSLDNRRLYVFKVCHSAGKLEKMNVEIVEQRTLTTPEQKRYRESLKRSSTSSIRFRHDDEEILEHTVCNCQKPRPSNRQKKSKKSSKPQLRAYTQHAENEIMARDFDKDCSLY